MALVASAAWAVLGLAIASTHAWQRRSPSVRAAPVGRAWRGIVYALGPEGMSPRAKESASLHPVAYAAGVLYHAGVFVALASLALLPLDLPSPARPAAAILLTMSFAAGLMLLARRIGSRLLREISAADDYFANVVVDLWLAVAALAWIRPAIRSPFLVVSIVVALYAPLGKIRHCVFFLLSRGLYGARLGRRGLVGAR